MRKIGLFLLIFMISQGSFSKENFNNLVILNGEEPVIINDKIEYFYTENKDLSIYDVMNSYKKFFIKNTQNLKHFGVYKESTHWIHFRIKNESKNSNWILFIDFSNIEKVDLYYKDAAGKIIHKLAGDNIDIGLSEMKTRIPAFKIENTNTIVDYYVRVYNRFPSIIPLGVMPKKDFVQKEFWFTWLFTIFLGISVATLLYNIIVAVISRRVIFVYFAIYIVSIITIELVVSGLAYTWIYKTESELGQRMALISMSVYCAAGMKFFQHLYNIGKSRKNWLYGIYGFIIIQIFVLVNTLLNDFFYSYITAWIDTGIYGFLVLGGSFLMLRTENHKIALLSLFAWIPLMATVFWLYAGFLKQAPFDHRDEFIFFGAVAVEQILFLMLALLWWRNQSVEFNKIENQFDELKFKTSERRISNEFLHNSLKILKILISKKDSAAEKTIEDLADVYEYMTYYLEKDLVPFREEREFTEKYFHVFNKSMKDGARLETLYDKTMDEILIPPLSIQPLVEKILKGFLHKDPKKTLKIQIHINNFRDRFCIKISWDLDLEEGNIVIIDLLKQIENRFNKFFTKTIIFFSKDHQLKNFIEMEIFKESK